MSKESREGGKERGGIWCAVGEEKGLGGGADGGLSDHLISLTFYYSCAMYDMQRGTSEPPSALHL